MIQFVSKGILKAKLLEYMRMVEKTKEEIIITDNNIPVLKIVPFLDKQNVETVFKEDQGKIKYYEDITLPTEGEWDAL